jgi:hypothetical protein
MTHESRLSAGCRAATPTARIAPEAHDDDTTPARMREVARDTGFTHISELLEAELRRLAELQNRAA